jgi:OOP family OmpA-OmpF porin
MTRFFRDNGSFADAGVGCVEHTRLPRASFTWHESLRITGRFETHSTESSPEMRSHRIIAPMLLITLVTAGCSQGTFEEKPNPTGAAKEGIDSDSVTFEKELRSKLALPPIPAFTIPTELLSTAENRRISGEVDVAPGLYQGIAVLDARCTDAGEATASDSGTPAAPATIHFEDEAVSITVNADGTGVYDANGIHVAVLADGSGVYEDSGVRLSVAADGSGTYESGDERYTVRADGSGSFDDGDFRLWIDETGAGGYKDDDLKVSISGAGKVFGDGDKSHVAAVQAVLEDGLPTFPPVPSIEVVEPTGTVCGTVIRLDANLLFEFGSADVQADGQRYLQRVATLLQALGSPQAEVNGHSDQIGDAAANLALSEKRAATVRDVLVGGGVSRGSLSSRGFGETEPLRPETMADGSDDPAARQLNRRVEIILLDG